MNTRNQATKVKANRQSSSSDVDWNEDGSCWVRVAAGRKRYFPKNHVVTQKARLSLTVGLLAEAKKENSRGGKVNIVYYRDETGKLCLPPSPDMVPKEFDRQECKSWKESDVLRREMEADCREQFGHDYMTKVLDEAQDNPRDALVKTIPMSNFERDVIGEMLRALDKEEADRGRVETSICFPLRESM